MDNTENLKALSLDELTDLYKRLNPHAAPNFKFVDSDRAVTQVKLAATYVASEPKEFSEEIRFLAKRVNGEVEWGAEFVPLPELDPSELTGVTDEPEPSAPKAPKVKKSKDEISASISAGTKASWENSSIRAARSARNFVKVGDQVFRSVLTAAAAVGIPEKYHIALRKVIKLQRHVSLKSELGVTLWTLLGPTGEDIGAKDAPVAEIDLKDVPKLARALTLPTPN